MKKLLALFVVVLGFSAASFAQSATATATASGTIVSAIGISKTGTDMNFGNVTTDATGGTVILTPAGTTSVGTGTLTLVAGTKSAAVFTVTGTGTSTYAITLPASHIITNLSDPAASMTVNTFTSTPSGTGTLANGTQDVRVGATLVVGNTTTNTPGVYTNAAGFAVTVNYN